ncbi:MAG: hypothetical protein M3Z24_05085, partial [Chloroflexota bacterium]|nr:hypothetical protein [Chloroflexota bacterium]
MGSHLFIVSSGSSFLQALVNKVPLERLAERLSQEGGRLQRLIVIEPNDTMGKSLLPTLLPLDSTE